MLASSDTTPAANTLDEAEASGGAVIGVDKKGEEGLLSVKEGGSALETSPSAGGEGKSVWEGGENWRKVKVRRWIDMGTLFCRHVRYISWFTLQDLEAGAPIPFQNAQKHSFRPTRSI